MRDRASVAAPHRHSLLDYNASTVAQRAQSVRAHQQTAALAHLRNSRWSPESSNTLVLATAEPISTISQDLVSLVTLLASHAQETQPHHASRAQDRFNSIQTSIHAPRAVWLGRSMTQTLRNVRTAHLSARSAQHPKLSAQLVRQSSSCTTPPVWIPVLRRRSKAEPPAPVKNSFCVLFYLFLLDCATTCDSCFGSSDNCTKCSGSLNLENNTCVETCTRGTYADTNECKDCDTACVACDITALNCTECPNPKLLHQSECLDTCPTSFVADQGICKPCPSNCLACSDSSTCTECSTSYFMDGDMTCEACDDNCATCSSLATQCLTCQGTDKRNPDFTCKPTCPTDYFNSNGICTGTISHFLFI